MWFPHLKCVFVFLVKASMCLVVLKQLIRLNTLEKLTTHICSHASLLQDDPSS